MIAAIAHDLRTPLTRLRFRIEAAPEDVQDQAGRRHRRDGGHDLSAAGFCPRRREAARRVKLEIASVVETVMDEAAETGADAAVEAQVGWWSTAIRWRSSG